MMSADTSNDYPTGSSRDIHPLLNQQAALLSKESFRGGKSGNFFSKLGTLSYNFNDLVIFVNTELNL